MRYIATLSEAGEGRTRVGLELKGAKDGPAGDVEQRFAQNPNTQRIFIWWRWESGSPRRSKGAPSI